jgi:hypothetical protein
LFELFARSPQAARTAANPFFQGGSSVAACHSRNSKEALAGVAGRANDDAENHSECHMPT